MSETETTSDLLNSEPVANVPRLDDWFLESIVTLANKVGAFEFGITLTVGGVVVTGQLISGRQYFTELGAILNRASNSQTSVEAGDIMRTLGENWSQLALIYDKPETDEGANPSPPSYIHLKSARYMIGAQGVPTPGMLWRGKLSSVDGFSIGHFS